MRPRPIWAAYRQAGDAVSRPCDNCGAEMQPYTPKRGPKQVVLFDKDHRRHCRTVRSLVSEAFGGHAA